jgi:hypothetical protein
MTSLSSEHQTRVSLFQASSSLSFLLYPQTPTSDNKAVTMLTFTLGKSILSVVNLVTIIGPYLADWK